MKQYQDKIKEFSQNCCLAICYIWAFEKSVTYSKLLKYIAIAIEKGYISENGFVKDADKLIFLVSGEKVKVEKLTKNPGKICIANFVNGANNHWCIVDENDNVIYNPLEMSLCVKNGHIEEYRAW